MMGGKALVDEVAGLSAPVFASTSITVCNAQSYADPRNLGKTIRSLPEGLVLRPISFHMASS